MKREVYDLRKALNNPIIPVISNSYSYELVLKNSDELKTISVKGVEIDSKNNNAKIFFDIEWTTLGPVFYDTDQFVELSDIKEAKRVYIKYESISDRRKEGDIEFQLPVKNKSGDGYKMINIAINCDDFICIIANNNDRQFSSYGYINDVVEKDGELNNLEVKRLICDKGIYSHEAILIPTDKLKGLYRYNISVTEFVHKTDTQKDN